MTKDSKRHVVKESEEKLKKVKKSGQKKPPKEKNKDVIKDVNKINKRRDKVKKVKLAVTEETQEQDNEEYELTTNDVEELGKPENKKNVISKRQMKREKFDKIQQEQKTRSSKELQDKALNYLSLWKHNKDNWKFQKIRQKWLTDHLFDTEKIPKRLWEVVIEYFSGSQGMVREKIIKESTKIVEEMSDWVEQNASAAEERIEFDKVKPCEHKYNRARELLQSLEK